ncbi:UNVERIFIED_CONTAM: hypothetical protein K2H54_030800 [Gekko kuhli]
MVQPPTEYTVIFYEGEVSHFAEDLKKWKDRYIVIKNNYAVESFENKEAFQKGLSAKSCILPVGGKVLTTEEEYNSLSDKHFPDPNGLRNELVLEATASDNFLNHPFLKEVLYMSYYLMCSGKCAFVFTNVT